MIKVDTPLDWTGSALAFTELQIGLQPLNAIQNITTYEAPDKEDHF
jgi:hypothetical protein